MKFKFPQRGKLGYAYGEEGPTYGSDGGVPSTSVGLTIVNRETGQKWYANDFTYFEGGVPSQEDLEDLLQYFDPVTESKKDMKMNKFEQLIEYVINDEEKAARELFHQIVVEKSRDIYESLMAEEDFGDDIDADETGGLEDAGLESEEDIAGGDEDFGGEDFGDDEMGSEDLEDRVVDLEDKLDELMAEFETLVGAEEEEHGEDFDMDGDIGGDAADDLEGDVEFGADDEETDEFGESIVREYTEKVADQGQKSEGSEVGAKGGSVGVNKQSTVAGKNPLGNVANAKNIAQSKSEAAPDGTGATKKPASNAYKTNNAGSLTSATTKPAVKQVKSLKNDF